MCRNVLLHVLDGHLQRETNSTDSSDAASDLHIDIGNSCWPNRSYFLASHSYICLHF